MVDGRDHYAVLGVARVATPAEVRKAYLELARRHHPDFHTTDDGGSRAASEREMQRINEAWAVLGDTTRRADYDAGLRHEQQTEDGARRGPGRASYDFTPFDDSDDPDIEFEDTPVPGTEVHRALQVLPPALFLGGAGVFVLGAIAQLALLVAVGIIAVVFGLLGFLATPAVAIMRSMGADRDP